ncbi:MAG: Na+/H+ antiporter NhaC family protein [Eubacteriales bacterium]
MDLSKEYSLKKYGFAAFLPLLLFLLLYVGAGLFFTLAGAESPFSKVPRHVALIVGVFVSLIYNPGVPMNKKVEYFCQKAGDSGVIMIVFIYLLAGGFQGAAAAMGGKQSVINLGLTYIPGMLLVPGVFLMCCLISTSIGTSMGTIAAMAPIALGVAEAAEINIALMSAAVIGGSYFGDNLSMISDTTISATRGCGAEMKDKFKMNFFIAVPAAVVACVLYAILGGSANITEEIGSYNLITIIPYIVVLFAALKGYNVAMVLFVGLIVSGVIGLLFQTVTLLDWLAGIGDGMSGMFSISIVAILISGIIGMVRLSGGIEWMVESATSKIKNKKGAEYIISLLSGVLSAALVNNTIAIIISAPIAKEIGGRYHIAPKRMASLVDIFACAFLSLMPHDGGMLIMTGLAAVSPIEVIQYSFYTYALVIAALITIQFELFSKGKTNETKIH